MCLQSLYRNPRSLGRPLKRRTRNDILRRRTATTPSNVRKRSPFGATAPTPFAIGHVLSGIRKSARSYAVRREETWPTEPNRCRAHPDEIQRLRNKIKYIDVDARGIHSSRGLYANNEHKCSITYVCAVRPRFSYTTITRGFPYENDWNRRYCTRGTHTRLNKRYDPSGVFALIVFLFSICF